MNVVSLGLVTPRIAASTASCIARLGRGLEQYPSRPEEHMDPNLFRLDWEPMFEALTLIVGLAFFVERAMAILFESCGFIETCNRLGVKELIAFELAVSVFRRTSHAPHCVLSYFRLRHDMDCCWVTARIAVTSRPLVPQQPERRNPIAAIRSHFYART